MSKLVLIWGSSGIGAGLLVLLGALVLAACYPGEITSIQQLDVAVTHWDTTYTWAKPDTVVGLYDSIVIVGSMNLDPRSLELNTEIGIVVTSRELCAQMREALERDFEPLNAWRVELDEQGELRWVCSDFVVRRQPAASYGQRLSSFFYSLLPIASQV